MNKGILALADGTIFEGKIFGDVVQKPVTGEVVFNTSMSGYQEVTTDPSYAGQIMTFTYPHIGNVGCNSDDWESNKVYVEGIAIRELSKVDSNFRSQVNLSQYLAESNKSGISDIDTRSLVIHLRTNGAQMGALASSEAFSKSDLIDIAKSAGSMEGKDYVKVVTCKKQYEWSKTTWKLGVENDEVPGSELANRPHVVVIDCGVKNNILRLLIKTGFRVTVVPAFTSAEAIMQLKPDGIFVSNGPGDPATLDYVFTPIKNLLGKVPIFGICLGLQMLSLAFGAKTYKLKFGHRGANHPVLNTLTGKVEITVQNHGFAVDPDSVPKGLNITHWNLNDRTVEGVESKDLKAFAVQYHPESSPGPHDSEYLFKKFYEMVVK